MQTASALSTQCARSFALAHTSVNGYGILVRRFLLSLLLFAIALATWIGVHRFTADRSSEYARLIAAVAHHEKLDPALLRAMVEVSSGYDARKVDDGAIGLMQVGAGTGTEWAAMRCAESFMVTDLFDPWTNLQVGGWYLRSALGRWEDAEDPLLFALADYLLGPDAVRKAGGHFSKAGDLRSALMGTEAIEVIDEILERVQR